MNQSEKTKREIEEISRQIKNNGKCINKLMSKLYELRRETTDLEDKLQLRKAQFQEQLAKEKK